MQTSLVCQNYLILMKCIYFYLLAVLCVPNLL